MSTTLSWNSQTPAESNAWTSIGYGNGYYFAVSSTGTNRVMYKAGDTNWTAISAAENNSWTSVAYGNARYYAVSSDGTNRVMYSVGSPFNGWVSVPVSLHPWSSITYAIVSGDGIFVAVANDGYVMSATVDGNYQWTLRTPAQYNAWSSVTFGNGLFVAVSSNGTNQVMTSPNAITWTARNAASNDTWSSVTYGNGTFVAVSSSGNVMTSPNGIDWTMQVSAEANSWTSVSYGSGQYNNKFVAVSSNGANRVMTSDDGGVTWLSENVGTSVEWSSVFFVNSQYYAVGNSGVMSAVFVNNTVITGFSLPSKTFGDLPVAISQPTSNSYAPFSYSSSNEMVASITNNQFVTIVGPGESTITASQPAVTGYAEGSATTVFEVLENTFENPVSINSNAGLAYFVGTEATYANLSSSVEVDTSLVTNGYKLLFSDNGAQITLG